jgi:CrcB protein
VQRLDPLLVAAGGLVGALLRHAVAVGLGGVAGTFAVNVAGSFVLGAVVVTVPGRRRQLLVGTGLLSSFTTYSTFAVDATTLSPGAAATYVGATYGLGVAAAAAGRLAGGRL